MVQPDPQVPQVPPARPELPARLGATGETGPAGPNPLSADSGLGLIGAGGLIEDLIDPPDPVTQSVGTNGAVPSRLAGGQNGLLGNIIGGPQFESAFAGRRTGRG